MIASNAVRSHEINMSQNGILLHVQGGHAWWKPHCLVQCNLRHLRESPQLRCETCFDQGWRYFCKQSLDQVSYSFRCLFHIFYTTPHQTAVRLRGSEEYLEVIPLDPNNGMVTELPKGDVHKFRRLQFLCYILKIVTFATVSCDGLWWFMDTTFLSLLNSFGNYQTACSASSRLL